MKIDVNKVMESARNHVTECIEEMGITLFFAWYSFDYLKPAKLAEFYKETGKSKGNVIETKSDKGKVSLTLTDEAKNRLTRYNHANLPLDIDPTKGKRSMIQQAQDSLHKFGGKTGNGNTSIQRGRKGSISGIEMPKGAEKHAIHACFMALSDLRGETQDAMVESYKENPDKLETLYRAREESGNVVNPKLEFSPYAEKLARKILSKWGEKVSTLYGTSTDSVEREHRLCKRIANEVEKLRKANNAQANVSKQAGLAETSDDVNKKATKLGKLKVAKLRDMARNHATQSGISVPKGLSKMPKKELVSFLVS